MDEKLFAEYKRKFKIIACSKWSQLDYADLECIFNESLAKAYLNYDESIGKVKFTTYFDNIFNRDVYIQLIRPKKYEKNKGEIADPQKLLGDKETLDDFWESRYNLEQHVIEREKVKLLDDCIAEYIDRKLRLKNCNHTRYEYELLFKMWGNEFDMKSICDAVGMDKIQLDNLMKSFRKKYRETFNF